MAVAQDALSSAALAEDATISEEGDIFTTDRGHWEEKMMGLYQEVALKYLKIF